VWVADLLKISHSNGFQAFGVVHKKGLKIAPCHKPVKAPALPRLRRP